MVMLNNIALPHTWVLELPFVCGFMRVIDYETTLVISLRQLDRGLMMRLKHLYYRTDNAKVS